MMSDPARRTRQRRLLLAVGAAAGVAGLGVAAWRSREAAPQSPARSAAPAGTGSTPSESAARAGGAGDPHSLWSLRLPRPGGGELVLAELRGRPLLVNFWATWCPPCIREMPEIDRFARQFASNGWQVVGIAVDQEKPVRDFLDRKPVAYPVALAGFEGVALSRQLGNDGGALPFTVAIDAQGKVVHRHLGETRFDVLAAWAAGMAGARAGAAASK